MKALAYHLRSPYFIRNVFGGAGDRKTLRLSAVVFLVTCLSSCVLLNPAYEKPAVHLVRIAPLSSSGFEQRFQVDLKIINPNSTSLSASGMSYTLRLNHENVVKGVAGPIAEIPPYSETIVQVEASTNILAGLRMISSLLERPGRELHYELETKLRAGWWPVPLRIIESGDITLP
jgi:LEA14-like dessication related protein